VNDLTSNIAEFVGGLRSDYGFPVGTGEAFDALRAIEFVNVTDGARVRCALRLTCCTSPDEIELFEEAFDAFFLDPNRGVASPAYAPRHTRPGKEPPTDKRAPKRPPADEPPHDSESEGTTALVEEQPLAIDDDNALAWQALRARFSPEVARSAPPEIPEAGFDAMRSAANALTSSVRLGRARRWKPDPHGPRFDVRRTLRGSLHTGGDPVDLHRLGHPHRNPRFVVLIDGSRSMAEHATPMLQFAAALCRRTRRARAYVFSTALRDITLELRGYRFGKPLNDLGEAWGGGTRLGASLLEFVRSRSGRPISDDTVVIIFSDGLDAGDPAKLERAMHDLQRRAAAVVWLNPHAQTPGYEPSARGMQIALPHVALFASATSAAGFRRLATRIPRVVRR